jgi:hypothetical protein
MYDGHLSIGHIWRLRWGVFSIFGGHSEACGKLCDQVKRHGLFDEAVGHALKLEV